MLIEVKGPQFILIYKGKNLLSSPKAWVNYFQSIYTVTWVFNATIKYHLTDTLNSYIL